MKTDKDMFKSAVFYVDQREFASKRSIFVGHVLTHRGFATLIVSTSFIETRSWIQINNKIYEKKVINPDIFDR